MQEMHAVTGSGGMGTELTVPHLQVEESVILSRCKASYSSLATAGYSACWTFTPGSLGQLCHHCCGHVATFDCPILEMYASDPCNCTR